MARLESLRLKDAVARHLGTHPFDPRVTSLSRFQAELFLELRHPADEKAIADERIKAEAEGNEERDHYRLGTIKMPEETPEDDYDFLVSTQ